MTHLPAMKHIETRLKIPLLTSMAALLLVSSTALLHADTGEIPDRVAARFTPGKAAVKATYSVAYRLLGLELRRLANAVIIAVEGSWQAPDASSNRPACLVSFRLDSLERRPGPRRGVILHNHIVAILAFPELDAILYAKRANEDIRIFAHRKHADNYEIYDLDGYALRYTCVNFKDNTAGTNLVGAAELTRQGKEVCRFLKILYDSYHTPTQTLASANSGNPTFFLYTEGDLVPFDFTLARARTPTSVLGARMSSLYLNAKPGAKAGGKGRNLELWALPFLDVAENKGCGDMIALARETLQWSMIPLVTDLGLSIGTIRGTLIDLDLIPLPEIDIRALANPGLR